MADVRRAVRESLSDLAADSLVMVALSGGPDSMALAAATAFEAPRASLRAGAIVINHGLQEGSERSARQAADAARALGLDPVVVTKVTVIADSGIEADARRARYQAFEDAASELGVSAILLGHTLDDQAETVLLGLTRGAGATSLAGMSSINGVYRRPLLGIRRSETVAACEDQGLEVWDDPHNHDERFTRVRIRHSVLPVLEKELGPGVAEALARTAEHLQDDNAVLDQLTRSKMPEVNLAEGVVSLSVAELETMEPAILARVVRTVMWENFGMSASAAHTDSVTRLISHWHGQGESHLPGIRVERQGTSLVFTPAP
jgi:tRNA(Ile)-lysidine synthase